MLADSKNKSRQRGDTIIEVLFAISVFSLVAVGSLSIMNIGVSSAQRSLEITLVRQQIDAQAEALRFIHHSYVSAYTTQSATYSGVAAVWKDILTHKVMAAEEFGTDSSLCPAIRPEAFIMNARTAKVSSITPLSMSGSGSRPYSQVVYGDDTEDVAIDERDVVKGAEGIWIEAVGNDYGNEALNRSGFVDFHIRACWNSPGSNVPVTIGTIVRLYEPRG